MTLSTPLARSKSAAMTRVLDLVSRGYVYYTCGTVPAHKLMKLVNKFHERYGVCCSPAQRISRKKAGLANALLVLFQPAARSPIDMAEMPSSALANCAAKSPANLEDDEIALISPSTAQINDVQWLLLVTQGTGAVWSDEKLKPVQEKPHFSWLGYELVRQPVRGKISWTWRRPKNEMRLLFDLLAEQFNKHRFDAVEQTLLRISRQPGFAGVREQSKQLFTYAAQRGYSKEYPTLFFMQKISHGEAFAIKSSIP